MLAWPALALLRASLPEVHMAVLVPAYTAPLAEICPSINEVITDPKERGDWRNGRALARLLRAQRFDAVITLFSRFDTGLAVWSAGIPYRLAPATKLAQVFYNHRLRQRRSESVKPEYAYNVDLVNVFLQDHGTPQADLPAAPYLRFNETETRTLERGFRQHYGIATGRRLVFVHAGHGGSASNLSLTQFAQLIRSLQSPAGVQVVLTAGPGEAPQAQALAGLLTGLPHAVYQSDKGLVEFARHLQFCDVFISGSTGPLHIAAALNRCTAAFYPRRRSSTALRWKTINDEQRQLAFTPPEAAGGDDMGAVDVAAAAGEISRRFLN
ncbi:MAG: glycosyltransferase family 9 protein [Gammaproteobacteria bacterium]|nr:glycosyltransferase family 9 protein [Gammaproteobacteria bacterium]